MPSSSVTPPLASDTIFIVDDDPSVVTSVARFFRAAGYRVKAFESAREFLDQLTPDVSGCVVVDYQMPGLNGLELQEALGRTPNPLPVIFLSGQGDIPITVRAMRGGAVDFLTKRASKEELLAAVERALRKDAAERQQRARLKKLHSRLNELSEREMEVLSHVVRGRMNKQIAMDLGINERTVKLHRTNLTRKLEVQSVAELTRIVSEAGLFPAMEPKANSLHD